MDGRTNDNRFPGESFDIIVIDDMDSFDQHFDDFFINELTRNNFPVVGFNMKWDTTMSTNKQRNKNAKKNMKQANIKARYDKFNYPNQCNGRGEQFEEEDEAKATRTGKAAYGQIALVTLSTLSGLTLQIRTCLFPVFPEKLKAFLECGNFWKVGFGLRKDMYRLWEEQKCQLLSWVDMRHLLMNWKEFCHTYHFRRMGTYSVASFLFAADFQNKGAAACADWYTAKLRREQLLATAEQTQLDVDLLAQLMIKKMNLIDERGRFLTIFDQFPNDSLEAMMKLLNEQRNKTWDQSKYNFSEMPVIRKTFDDSERKNLPSSGDWVRARIVGDTATNVQKLFGGQPYLGVNMDNAATLPLNYETELVSDNGDYILTMELEEIKDLASVSSTNSSEKEILRKNFRRSSFEKALQTVSGGTFKTGIDPVRLAKLRKAKRLAAAKRAAVGDDDDDGGNGDFDMSDLHLSELEDENETISTTPEFCSTDSNDPGGPPTDFDQIRDTFAAMADKVRGQPSSLDVPLLPPPPNPPPPPPPPAFDYNNPNFFVPRPMKSATNVRMLRPVCFGRPPTPGCSPVQSPPPFQRVPVPFLDNCGRPIAPPWMMSPTNSSSSSFYRYQESSSSNEPDKDLSISPLHFKEKQSKSLITMPPPFNEPSRNSFVASNSLVTSSSSTINVAPTTKIVGTAPIVQINNPTQSVVFAKGRGKLLEVLQKLN